MTSLYLASLLFQQSVKYLGYVVSAQGIHADPEKIAVVQNWPQPHNVKQLRQFLGFASYYRKFIHQFAQIATPLYQLIEKSKSWHWSTNCENCFSPLKTHLISSPVQTYPNFNFQFSVPPPPAISNLLKPVHQMCFVAKYLSENAPEVISESLKLNFSWGSMPHRPIPPLLAMCLHTWMLMPVEMDCSSITDH